MKRVFKLSVGVIIAPAFIGCGGVEAEPGFVDGVATDVAGVTQAANCPPGANFIQGSQLDDVIIGTDGVDCIFGGPGNDTISGLGGADRIFGESGNDTIDGGSENDLIWGGSGNDELWGQDGVDQLVGGRGNDTLIGGLGNDILSGNQGDDTLTGEAGEDRMYGHEGNDTIVGDAGRDRIWGGPGVDTIDSGDGIDWIVGGDGDDSINTGLGNDNANGEADCDVVDGVPDATDVGSAEGLIASGTTVGALNNFTPGCLFSTAGDHGFLWVAPRTATFAFDTYGSTYDSGLYVLDGRCGGAELVCNDDSMSLQSRVELALTAGQLVTIVVDGYSDQSGDFVLNVHEPSCGDGFVEGAEQCDDGNNLDGDFCSATCQIEPGCGNGVWEPELEEGCDDGNNTNGDGCSATCGIEQTCGNSLVEGTETCDDGNTADGDWCSSICQIEPGCGNAIIEPELGEMCDDGNGANGDGCSATCQLEALGVFTFPPDNTATFTGAIDPESDQDFYRLDVGGPMLLRVATFENATTGLCDIADTVISVYDSFGNLIGQDDEGGVNHCSMLPGMELAAGTYFLGITAWPGSGVIPTYDVVIQGSTPACGDGFVGAGEQCDDGNTADGDGCSSTCSIEFVCPVADVDLGSATGAAVANGSNELLDDTTNPVCTGGTGGHDAIFAWTAPASGSFTFTTAGSTFDTVIYLFGVGCDQIACHDDVAFPADPTSTVTVDLSVGQAIWIVVDGYSEFSIGDYVLNITESALP
ncbi:MAG: DUF4215 domain-containing protein [Deltaproteobacteria bacterium]|nr:DUF4215 domain-containing protein [Deltaproteobacteria bacterium]